MEPQETNADEEPTAEENEGEESSEGEVTGDEEPQLVNSLYATVREGIYRQAPVWMNDYVARNSGFLVTKDGEDIIVMFIASEDPDCFKDAEQHEVWRKEMEAEITSIEENNTWELMDLPVGAKVIGVKWVFKMKFNENGEIDKFLGETGGNRVSSMARWDTIRSIIATAAHRGWYVFQLDVNSAFLHGELSEEVYVEQPKGFEVKDKPSKVYKLNKALYGLKQAPRAWYSRIESYIVKEKFEKCYCDHTLFVTREENNILIVSLYVDDLIYSENSVSMLESFKNSMMEEFSMTGLGRMKYFLGVEVIQDEQGIFINQQKYAKETLKKYRMESCNSVKIIPLCLDTNCQRR